MGRFRDRIAHAWNAFRYQETHFAEETTQDLGPSYTFRPQSVKLRFANEKTIIAAIYNRIAIDVASVPMRHVRLNANRQYQEDIDSGLNDCLTVQANLDQGSRQFRQDIVQSLFDQGVVAILPVETTLNPLIT